MSFFLSDVQSHFRTYPIYLLGIHVYILSSNTVFPDITATTTQCMSTSHSSAGVAYAYLILMVIIHVDLSLYGAFTPNLRMNITSEYISPHLQCWRLYSDHCMKKYCMIRTVYWSFHLAEHSTICVILFLKLWFNNNDMNVTLDMFLW